MYVSAETSQQTDGRLRAVLGSATIEWLNGPYAFEEYSADRLPEHRAEGAIAFVRDAEVWSVLCPASEQAVEQFGIFLVHFPDDVDNSGFAGWLASRLKSALGTGIFVVCGQNSRRGGIFDYWGVPVTMVDGVEGVLAELRAGADIQGAIGTA